MNKFFLLMLFFFFSHSETSFSYLNQFIQQKSSLPSGFCVGTDFGFAWIKSPIQHRRCEEIEEVQKGHFAWGIFGAYLVNIVNIVSVGGEIAYHDNGKSTFTFQNSSCYQLKSRDWSFLATVYYPLCSSVFLYIKGGGARILQTNENVWKRAGVRIYPMCKTRRWDPTLTVGASVSVCNWIYPFFQFRFIFGNDFSRFRSHAKFKEAASVKGVFGGLLLNF